MLCPLCYGKRLLIVNGQVLPCPECQGQGEMHCCEGLQEQPEAAPPENPPVPKKPLEKERPRG